MLMSFFTVFGGLAIFIYGMKMMSDGLHKMAGERMRVILHFFSSNRLVAILAGTVVTAVVQSSSATTVMVIGFVNAGLLSLLKFHRHHFRGEHRHDGHGAAGGL